MMGYSHAVTGTAGWLALTSTSGAALAIYDPGDPMFTLGGAFLCAGTAMAPDADHGQASIAHSLPPVSKWAAQGIGAVSGGHRHGTHSLIGITVYTLVAWLLSFWVMDIEGRTVAVGSGLLAVLLVAFATKTFGLHRSVGRGFLGDLLGTALGPWIVALGTAGLATYYMDERWSWLPICMAVGTFIHVLGDSLTVQGVPWLWPWNPKPPRWFTNTPILKELWLEKNGYFRLPILGRTGGSEHKSGLSWGSIRDSIVSSTLGRKGAHKTSWQETIFITLVTIYTLYLIAYEVLHLAGAGSMLF